MIKAVIFDLDGVLVSTDHLHYLAWKRLAEELGISDFTEKDNARQRGVSRMASLEIVLEKTSKRYTEEEKYLLAERKNEYYREMLKVLSPRDVLSGVNELLRNLHRNNILIGVGSASKNTPQILDRTGLAPFMDKVCCGLDITHSKPDPEVFLVAAQKLSTDPQYCLVVEDADAGIQAAQAAGMSSLAVGAARQNPTADYRLGSLAEITPEFLQVILMSSCCGEKI